MNTLPGDTELVPRALPKTSPGRWMALDVFRGATILLMILVNNPGSWSHVYAPLLHAPWHGWTPTDLVFPFFLFIVGVAIPLAFARRLAQGASRRQLLLHSTRRGAILFALGVFLAAYPIVQFTPEFGLRSGLESLRIFGVLQRIGLCYLLAVVVVLYLPARGIPWLIATCLLGYWALLSWVPVPGHGAGRIDDPAGNLSAYVDRWLLGRHIWSSSKVYDPEGVLSTLGALATTLLGVTAGRMLSQDDPVTTCARLAVRGLAYASLGFLWSYSLPINKPIWTSSYALLTGGLAMQCLAACIWWVDVRGHRRSAQPLVIYGVNALTVFVGSALLAKSLRMIEWSRAGGGNVRLPNWFYETALASWLPSKLASLTYALLWVGLWFLILRAMFRRNWIVKL